MGATNTQTSTAAFSDADEQFAIRVVYSPDPALPGLVMDPAAGPLEIGRAGADDHTGRIAKGRLAVSDSRLSRHHVLLRREKGEILCTDLDSKNGTRRNGSVCASSSLVEQDVLRVGDTLLVACRPSLGDPDEDGEGMVGVSAALREVRRTLRRIAPAGVSVVIHGETGTGKELVAQALHRRSGRRGRLVILNCAAIPEALVESELFGVRRGAFTGADRDRRGAFAEADGGTLFLDEVADMSLAVQARLLRAIETGEVQPLGGSGPVRVDVRCLAASHADLSARAAAGEFRADLLHRLNRFTLRLPPLRMRREDVPLLWRHFTGEEVAARTSAHLMEALLLHTWPGNVRELRNVAERVALEAGEAAPALHHLPPEMLEAFRHLREGPAETAPLPLKFVLLPRGERPTREQLIESLRRHRGNLAGVAREFGRPRTQAYRWLRIHDLDPDAFRRDP